MVDYPSDAWAAVEASVAGVWVAAETLPVIRFLVEAAAGGDIGPQAVNASFNIKITALDPYNNPVLGFVGTVIITSTGTLTLGGGETAAFTNGVLASHTVRISNAGTWTITATKTGDTEAGTSNAFVVS